jgi:hypothetical protein
VESQPSFDDIVSFFERYQSTFERLEPQAIARFWCAPTLALEPGRNQACVDDAELLRAFESATRQLREAGMHSASFALEEVRVLRDDLVDCVVSWDLRDAAGTTLKRLHNIYVLRRTTDDWGVAAVYLLPPERPLIRLMRPG